jgi:hypothetical protein
VCEPPFAAFFESDFKESPERGMPRGVDRRILAVPGRLPVEQARNFPTAPAPAS